MALSPQSGQASSSVNPGKKSVSSSSSGPVNQRSPSPLTRMANSRPFRVRHVTMLPSSIVAAASRTALPAAIPSVRK